ncbi:MAG TPA: nucleoside recognition domain-containing protein, partial [Syntrophorhabdaceae bacterium]|nr:nucleoside recognition domain-containing protein [Syntrophorhabdaceae bacterium]
CSIVLWIMSNIPGGTIEQSMLAWIGRLLAPIGVPIGLDWRMMVALLSSVIAKENSIATLGVLYNVGDQGLISVLSHAISHASAVSFLVILMLFIPCVPTITVMKQEMGSTRWSLASFAFMLVLSYALATVAYRLALALAV